MSSALRKFVRFQVRLDLKKELEIMLKLVAPYCDELYEDGMGNLIALKKGKSSEKRAMVAAHMDEIGFIVKHIDDKGFIFFHPLGGFDPKTLTAQRVIIHGKEDVIGVMGSKPIHVMSPEERGKALNFLISLLIQGFQVKPYTN